MKLITLEDFKSAIGKRVFRDDNQCPCSTCKEITKNGMILTDEIHAEYLYDTQNDYAGEQVYLNYRTDDV